MAQTEITSGMVWNDFSPQQRDAFDRLAEEKQDYFVFYRFIMQSPRCLWCRMKNPGKVGPLDFHVKSTHGFTIDEIINYMLVRESIEKTYENTNYCGDC